MPILFLTVTALGCNDHTSQKLEEKHSELESSTSPDKNPTEIEDKYEQETDNNRLNENLLDNIYTEVVNDSIREYKIAKKHGELVDICVQAGMVVAAQLQAQNENGYRDWKKIEKTDCDNYENQEMADFHE